MSLSSNNANNSDGESESESNNLNVHDQNNYFQNSGKQFHQQQQKHSNFIGPANNGSFNFRFSY